MEAMKTEKQTGVRIEKNNIKLYNCDNLELMSSMPDGSVDVILTDPPYLYLKNQKLDKEFDENLFFSECKRVLVKDGFIVLFGRGTSFYRWNTILADLGFTFKEEIVWDKRHISSPLLPIGRCHEIVSIHTKGNGSINKVKVPYLEMKGHDLDAIVTDIKKLRTVFKNAKSLKAVQEFIELNYGNDGKPVVPYSGECNANYTSVSGTIKTQDRCASVMAQFENGSTEKTIVQVFGDVSKSKHCVNRPSKLKVENRCVAVARSMQDGHNEKSIISQRRDHYGTIHPTQKPVRLLERLLALVIPKDKESKDITVFDPFGGSFSTMEAVYNMQMQGISCEIDEEYFESGRKRIENLPPIQAKLF